MEMNKNGALKDEEKRTAGLRLFRVSKLPTSLQCQEVIKIEDYVWYYAIKKGEFLARPSVCLSFETVFYALLCLLR
jgi:hypothetical protein